MRLSLGKTVVFLSTILSLALLTGCSLGTAEMEKTDIDVLSEKSSKSWEQAETTPLGKYPELVTYTLGQMKGANNSNLPDGQTYEDNAYTRYLKKTLNIQNKNVFMDYQRNQTDVIFKPLKRLEELMGKDKDIKMDLIVARKMAEKSNCSYIFGRDSREIFFKKNNEFKNYATVIQALFDFALKDLFVIRNSHSGVISANFLLPMAFRIEKEKTGMKGDFAVPLMEPAILDVERKEILNEIVDQINTVLYTIIPGMCIEVKDYGRQAMDSGEEGWKVELMSNRDGKRTIPIRMESEGIIKIISILNVLIQAFGNPSICLVIDELDAGVFEYMLGELLDIFNKSAKGQLIFTSHNLRALEMLDKDSIMFSTANPDNRYIHMKNVKESNNLRSMYIRSITLGGQEENIYEETDSLKIARAFRKAGRRLQNE